MRKILAVTLVAFVMCAVAARAQVADSSANGFTYKLTLTLRSSPETVYQRLIAIGNWWDSAHTYSGDARNLTLDAKPLGCWCETLPNGGGVRHMEVLTVMPGKRLVMSGGLGPLQSLATTGTLTITLAPVGSATKMDVTYAVAGYLAGGMNTLAEPVGNVLTEQFARLKNYVETGSATPKPGKLKE